ncbi:MAG: DUF4013 domain-containing protein [Candidatus Promineofilum sp.]|nr:DUF4013 domain-containing protein [Promineifilum sp.]
MEDKQWISKLLIGALMSVLGFLIVPALILQGYVVKIIRQVMNGNWDGLPEWENWGDLLKDGFFVTVAQFVYTLPFILLMIIGGAATGGMASLTGSDDLSAIAATGGGLLLLCLVILFAVALLFLTPAILIQYAIKDDFGACFRFGEVFGIIRNNMSDILIAFVVTLVAALVVTLLIGILSLIPCLGWIAAFLIGLAVGPYISYVGGHLYGQIAAKILGNKAGSSLSGMA